MTRGAQFRRIDSQIRENRLILANCFRVPELNPFLLRIAFRGVKLSNRRLEPIRANRSHVLIIGVFFQRKIDSKRPHSRCESPGHLSSWLLFSLYFHSLKISTMMSAHLFLSSCLVQVPYETFFALHSRLSFGKGVFMVLMPKS